MSRVHNHYNLSENYVQLKNLEIFPDSSLQLLQRFFDMVDCALSESLSSLDTMCETESI